MSRLIVASVIAGLLAAWTLTCVAADKPPRTVIEDTYIIAPRTIGEYALVKTVDYAAQGDMMAGVGLRYHDTLMPAMVADLYIYPAGDNESLDHAERTFRDSVKQAAKLGAYSDVRWGTPRDIDAPEHDGNAWHGRAIPMQVHRDGAEFASNTYLFHRGLYNYKLRADVPAQQAGALSPAADAMLRAVLGHLQVVSTGSCGRQMKIVALEAGAAAPEGYTDGVSADGWSLAINEAELKETSDAKPEDSPLVRRMVVAVQRQIEGGCTATPFEPQAGDDATLIKLHYPAGFWQSAPAPQP